MICLRANCWVGPDEVGSSNGYLTIYGYIVELLIMTMTITRIDQLGMLNNQRSGFIRNVLFYSSTQ